MASCSTNTMIEDDDESHSSLDENTQASLVDFLEAQLTRTLPREDAIWRCGDSLLSALGMRPREVLREAHRMLYSTKASEVDICWLRLFEEASLHLVLSLLRDQPPAGDNGLNKTWLAEVVAILDRAMIIAGAPGRRQVINYLLEYLELLAVHGNTGSKPQLFDVTAPPPVATPYPIIRSQSSFTTGDFKTHLNSSDCLQPTILPGLLSNWPALHLWQDLGYLRHRTMGGLRLVPIEIGSSYTSPDWSQKIVTFGHFADTYLGQFENDRAGLPPPHQPREVAYLAQHDLFTHIPSLLRDIIPPSLLSISPPPPAGAALQTPGLAQSLPHRGEPPRKNAWLGPAGTKTPLHTDPWHNLFCQVVGWKYIRLYPPDERERLYPRGSDENGVDGSNTSSVDVQILRPMIWRGEEGDRGEEWRCDRKQHEEEFPLAEDAEYVEAMLGPGDSIYVPLGWWHYVESLTTSFSVSFWWI